MKAARDVGCTWIDVREALLVVSLFAGFPRTLDAFEAARAAWGDGGGPEPENVPTDAGARHELFAARGRELFARVYGGNAGRVLDKLEGLDPELKQWILADAYGKVLARPFLSPADTERLAVVLLATLSLRNQLPGHVRGALRCGATAAGLTASLDAAAAFIAPDDLALARDLVARGLPG